MTIIFIIIAVFCVVVTSFAWVVVIYRTRKRKKSIRGNAPETAPLRHKYDDFEPTTSAFPPLAPFQVMSFHNHSCNLVSEFVKSIKSLEHTRIILNVNVYMICVF